MKILVLSNNAGGLFSFRKEVLLALSEGNDLAFCVPDSPVVSSLEKLGFRYLPCDALNRRSTNPKDDLKLLSYYNRLLSDEKPDLVLTYTIKPNAYGGMVCRWKRIPYIANVTGIGTSIENGGLLSAISKMMYREGLKKAACVFFQNSSNRDLFLRERLVHGRTRCIPGSGVNLEEHYPEPYPSEDEGIRFLFAGRVMKDKGVRELLGAMDEIRKEHPEVSLDVAGPYEENFRDQFRQAEEKGALRYHGSQSDIHSYYKRSHCVVLPSYHEGTSNVMLEASATARPVITTRVPGCMETFEEGVTGFGCEARDTESLVEAMRRFLALSPEEREKMGLAARAKVEREFDRRTVVRAYLEESENAVKRGKHE